MVVQVFLAAESEVLRIHHRYGDDSPDRPLTTIVVAARVAHPSAPHSLAAQISSVDD